MTKQEKIKTYKEAKKLIKQGAVPGLCSAIYFASNETIMAYNNMPRIVKKHKPNRNSAYWFPPFTSKPRIEILNKVIKELEAK